MFFLYADVIAIQNLDAHAHQVLVSGNGFHERASVSGRRTGWEVGRARCNSRIFRFASASRAATGARRSRLSSVGTNGLRVLRSRLPAFRVLRFGQTVV